MTNELATDVAVVSGGTKGIGRAISEKLLNAGATTVALYANDDDAAEDTEAALEGADSEFAVLKADVATLEEVTGAFEDITQQYGTPSILVNNAGVMQNSLLLRMDPEEWQSVIETNLTGTFNCTRVAARAMLRNGGGRIVNMSSVAAKRGWTGQSNYAASKAGIEGFTRAAARELGDRSIRVNAVCPGYTDTDMLHEEVGVENVPHDRITTGEVGEPSEIADAVRYLVSDDSSYVNGEVLRIDGGLLS